MSFELEFNPITPVEENAPSTPNDPPAGDPPSLEPAIHVDPLEIPDPNSPDPAGVDPVVPNPGNTSATPDVDPNSDPATPDPEVPDPATVEPDLNYMSVANELYNKGFITEVPEGIDREAFKQEDFWTVVQHNWEKSKAAAVDADRRNLAQNINDTTRQILEYNLSNPNAEEGDILALVEGMQFGEKIKSYTVENNAEDIVRTYYASQNWTNEEIETKLVNLAESKQLESEATLLKPKLDSRAEKLTQDKINQAAQIAQAEKQNQAVLKNRTIEMLKTGKINGVELTREEVSAVYNFITNQDVQVPVKGGKTFQLGAMEALIYHHRYGKEGNLTNLALAALILQGGEEKVRKFFKNKQNAGQGAEAFFTKTKAAASKTKPGSPTQPSNGGGLFTLNFSK